MPARKPRPRKPPLPDAPPRLPPDLRDRAEACARLAAAPAPNRHAAGIDVGDATHWVCVGETPDGTDPVREFPAHTPGLRQLVAWLKECGVTTVALEAGGVYGHVLYLTLLEAGFDVTMAPPHFAKQIKGRRYGWSRRHVPCRRPASERSSSASRGGEAMRLVFPLLLSTETPRCHLVTTPGR